MEIVLLNWLLESALSFKSVLSPGLALCSLVFAVQGTLP